METELKALEDNDAWQLTFLLAGKQAIGCKWVYKLKYLVDGTLEKYKSRLAAKGYNQVEGIYYSETFSPIAKISTIRTLLAFTTSQNLFLHQLDINNAFLHGDLEEEVYVNPSKGLELPHPDMVCKLNVYMDLNKQLGNGIRN